MTTSEVYFHVSENQGKVTVKVSIFGVAAWGFTSAEDYSTVLTREVQKVLALGVNSKELIEKYRNETFRHHCNGHGERP